MIERGRVAVNGTVVSRLPVFVDPGVDRITVDGRPLRPPERRLYVMLNKPERVLSTTADEPGAERKTVLDLVKHPSGVRLYPVGRLEYEATGLVLLTNDGELARVLTHPSSLIPRVYQAVIRGTPTPLIVQGLQRDIARAQAKIAHRAGQLHTSRVELAIRDQAGDRTTLELTLKEGRSPLVRPVLTRAGFPLRRLELVSIGPLALSGLARGQWRELEREEIHALRKAAKPHAGSAQKSRVRPPGRAQRRQPAGKPDPAPRRGRGPRR